MTITDPRADRTALRLALYENGFTPLPNHFKACFLPEWSSLGVTPELIQSREWSRNRSWSDTGLRCGEIIAVDWDVNDPDLLNALLDEVVAADIIVESPFVRIGKPPRELWVYRTSDKIGKRTTGAFMVDEESEEEKVEILGAGCQFAGYGLRDENTPYTWPERDLLDAQYMDLPEVTLAQVEALKDFAIAFFERNGLERKSPMAGTDGGYTHVYDLTQDMKFNVKGLGELTVAEIGDYLRQASDEVLRCTVETLRPTGGSWAGMISLVHGDVCLSDHGTYTAHFPIELDATKVTAELGALLSPMIEQRMHAAPEEVTEADERADYEQLDTHDEFDTNLERALQRFVFVAQTGDVCDLGADFMMQDTRTFHNTLRPHFVTKIGSRGGEVITRLSEFWFDHPDHRIALTAQMRPDMPRPFFTEDGGLHLNTFRPADHEGTLGDAQPGFDMLRRLLPNPEERHFFEQWLAHKLLRPDVPGPAVVMVAPDAYGTGRGTLFKLLRRMFGRRYVVSVDFNTLAGKTSQSQYNEWRTDSLLVTVNEAQDTTGGSRWQARNSAYEHLKDIIDPGEQYLNVVRKGVRNTQGQSFASVIVASNHGDALVIPENDRRIAVLENGSPQSADYWEGIHRWIDMPDNVSAFVRAVRQTDLCGFNAFSAPPMTRAKADMIEAGASDLDRAVAQIIEEMPGKLVTKEQVILRLEDYVVTHSVEFPEGWVKTAEAIMRRATRKLLGEDRLMIEGKQRVVRAIGDVPPEVFESSQTMREEIDKNGPMTRVVNAGGKVVSFPQR